MMRNKKAVKASLFTLMVTLIAIGTVAVAAVMKKEQVVDSKKSTAPESGWYIVEITDLDYPEDEANQKILALDLAPPAIDPTGCAQEDNFGHVCMVELTFDDNATTVPTTVAAALLPGSLTSVGVKARSPEKQNPSF